MLISKGNLLLGIREVSFTWRAYDGEDHGIIAGQSAPITVGN